MYCDASALIKLFLEEEGSAALREFLSTPPRLVSAEIVRVEIHRALRRGNPPLDAAASADRYLAQIQRVRLDTTLLQRASRIGPPNLRTLDAIHLAAALSFSPLPEAFLCYDHRLASAARYQGLTVVAPGFDEVHEP